MKWYVTVREILQDDDPWDENCPICRDDYEDESPCLICGQDGTEHAAVHPHAGFRNVILSELCPGFVQPHHLPYILRDLGDIERNLRS